MCDPENQTVNLYWSLAAFRERLARAKRIQGELPQLLADLPDFEISNTVHDAAWGFSELTEVKQGGA